MTDLVVILGGVASSVAAVSGVYSLVRTRAKARTESLHRDLSGWFQNGGAKEIGDIVEARVKPVRFALELHEKTEPQRFREYMKDYE